MLLEKLSLLSRGISEQMNPYFVPSNYPQYFFLDNEYKVSEALVGPYCYNGMTIGIYKCREGYSDDIMIGISIKQRRLNSLNNTKRAELERIARQYIELRQELPSDQNPNDIGVDTALQMENLFKDGEEII